jgi:hypothetical protein
MDDSSFGDSVISGAGTVMGIGLGLVGLVVIFHGTREGSAFFAHKCDKDGFWYKFSKGVHETLGGKEFEVKAEEEVKGG